MATHDLPQEFKPSLDPNYNIGIQQHSNASQNQFNKENVPTTTRILEKFTDIRIPRRTKAQVIGILEFYDLTCKKGSEAFNVPHPLTGDIIECLFENRPRPERTSPGFFSVTYSMRQI